VNWAEVMEQHGSTTVKIRDGQAVSLLCGSGGYKDSIADHTVLYTIPRRHIYRHWIKALEVSAASGAAFTVYSKLKKNDWRDLGPFTVRSVDVREHDVLFTLVSAA
jgi:hypothetical protein